MLAHREGVRYGPQQEASREETSLLAPWPWTSKLPELGEMSVCFSQGVCRNSLQQPQQSGRTDSLDRGSSGPPWPALSSRPGWCQPERMTLVSPNFGSPLNIQPLKELVSRLPSARPSLPQPALTLLRIPKTGWRVTPPPPNDILLDTVVQCCALPRKSHE